MRSRLAALVVAPLLAVVLAPGGAGTPPLLGASATPSVRVESAWGASVGAGGANGKVTVRAFDTGAGTIILALKRLSPSSGYAVAIRRGVCPSSGTVVVSLGKLTTSASGALSATRALTGADVAAIRAAASGTRRVSLAVGTGSTARCATLAKSLAVTPQIWFAPLPGFGGR